MSADRAAGPTSVTPDPRLASFVAAQGLGAAGEEPRWTPLAGGVSSDIWRVDIDARTLCVKCALPKLKVARAWHAPVSRNAYEWAWLRFVARHCPGHVPQPIAHDPSLGAFAMEYLDPATHPVWKARLLAGEVDVGFAASVATLLAQIHAASTRESGCAAAFGTDAVFHAIRLEPYLLATAERHPGVAASLRALAADTLATQVALVHGDVSPKNILVGPAGPIFLDAECAWFGDPAFDVAFCLNHLLLKCLVRPADVGGLLAAFAGFTAAYLPGVTWEPRGAIEARAARLLPALFLARVDGKSPVEYITTDAARERVRRTALPLIESPVPTLAEVAAAWQRALREG